MKNNQKGFIALTSVSLLGAFFILLFVGMFFSSTEALDRTLNKEMAIKSLSLANSCAEIALNEIRKDPDYFGGEVKTIGEDNCEIKNIESFGLYGRAIKTEAQALNQHKKIQIEIDVEQWSIIEVIAWREVSEFSSF